MIPSPVKTALAACAMAALSAFAPTWAEAQVGRFMGGGTIFNFTPACVNAGWDRNSEAYLVRFQPANIGSNADRDLLTFLGSAHSFSMQRDGGFTTWWSAVDHAFLGSGIGYSNATWDDHADLRIMSMWPSDPDANTMVPVRIRGQIRHFGHVPWCRVDFDVIVQQR